MMKSLWNGLRRMVGVFWKGVSAFRRFVGNILFLALIIFFISIFFFDRGKEVPHGAALILALSGNIVEQKTETMLSNEIWGDAAKEEMLLKEILDVIDYAKDDQRIKALVLDLRELDRAGLSKLQDIGAALNRFKSSGKPIIANGDYYNQRQYYLAAHAEKVYISPMGGVMLYGFGLYRTYFKSALEKLRVNLHAFIVGTYKSALEPLLRDNMSKYAKEANLAWLKVLWDTYKTDIAAQRGLDPGSIDDYINNIPKHLAKVQGDMARLALHHGFVDGLKTRDEVRDELIGLVGEGEKAGTFKQIEFDD
jgi:protease-4